MTNAHNGVINIEATAIHLEDLQEWREEVRNVIEKVGSIHFQRFISSSSFEAIEDNLRSAKGPVVLFLDLRLSDQRGANSGYRWLLTELQHYIAYNPATIVFVISGLQRSILETLIHQGIPSDHIYDKGKWAKEQFRFVSVLRDAVLKIEETARERIFHGLSGEGMDTYLLHALERDTESNTLSASESENTSSEDVFIPMVVLARTETWHHQAIQDLRVVGQIGTIYSCLGTTRALISLDRDPEVIKVEASRIGTTAESNKSLPFIKADVVHRTLEERGDQCLIAIIDTDIDVLNEAFRDSSGMNTRILAIWDQRDQAGSPPQGFTIGTEHTQQQINEYIRSGKLPVNLADPASDHGTHITSIAAGRPVGEFSGGVAPEAKLLIVLTDAKTSPERQLSLGYSISNLVALQYIRDFAERENVPVVINISHGVNSGPHDGTSNFERGIDQVTNYGSVPGIVIVKSAGNEGNRSRHANLRVLSYGREVLNWVSQSESLEPNIIELWYSAADRYRFSLADPNGAVSDWVDVFNPYVAGVFPTGNAYKMSLTRYDPDNGDSRLLVSIDAGAGKRIVVGTWSLAIESESVFTEGEIHAWLESSDSSPSAFTNHISKNVTLSVPGTAKHVITVGSVGTSLPAHVSEFSSYGPTRDNRTKPDLAAPGEAIHQAMSRDGSDVLMIGGTSIAAAHVSGAIALLFSLQAKTPTVTLFNANQVQRVLTQTSIQSMHGWDPGLGHGVLNVEALLSISL